MKNVVYCGKLIREQKGFSVRGLAKKVGIAPSTISKWEGNHTIPDIVPLALTADCLGVSINDLVRVE